MYKIKATKTEMKQNYYIIGIGYCNAHYLLKAFQPLAYSSGVYGWSCDYYDINDVIVSTGYSYIDNKRIKYDYEALRKLDKKASKIWNDTRIKKYQTKVKKVQKLFIEFLEDGKQ